jgi:hypothetical protein
MRQWRARASCRPLRVERHVPRIGVLRPEILYFANQRLGLGARMQDLEEHRIGER